MKKQKKNLEQYSFMLDSDIMKKYSIMARNRETTMSAIVRIALKTYLDTVLNKPTHKIRPIGSGFMSKDVDDLGRFFTLMGKVNKLIEIVSGG